MVNLRRSGDIVDSADVNFHFDVLLLNMSRKTNTNRNVDQENHEEDLKVATVGKRNTASFFSCRLRYPREFLQEARA
jgi:hypothetical protein